MFEALAGALEAGLRLWVHKEKNKYVDRLIEIRRAFYEEDNKPMGARSDAVLDNLRFELRVLAIGFAAEARQQDAQNQP